MEQKKNIVWINYLRAISILGVFFIHSQSYYGSCYNVVNGFVSPFYVNAFFFVSGFLIFRKQLSEKIINQECGHFVMNDGRKMIENIFWKLMLPSIIFSIIEFYPSHILRSRGFDIGMFLYKTLGGCTYWFTSALVVAEFLIFFMLLTRIKRIWFYWICCLLMYCIGRLIVANRYSLFDTYPSLPWQYKHGLYALVFMSFGGVYWRLEDKVNRFMNKGLLFFLIGIYIVCLLVWPSFFQVLISTLNLNVPGIILSLLSICILIEICKLLPTINLLNYIGQNTIGLYFMSGALPIVFSILVHKILSGQSMLGMLIVFFASFIVGLGAVYLMNRFVPFLFDLRVLWKKASK